jgi:GT2 family glycosyltransferase
MPRDQAQNAELQRRFPKITAIVPAHNRLAELQECLESLQSWRMQGCELILVDDASTGNVGKMAEDYGARYFRTPRRQGPASARNLGARHAAGEILVFVDADVLVSANVLHIIREEFDRHPEVAALFGSYDDEPRCADFFSTFKNLLHHQVHQTSKSEAVTFWSGCGAIRKQAFETVGGFNAVRYPTSSIEDIELGLRLVQQGEKVRSVKGLRVKHLKRWTLTSMVRTDIFQRAIPWTQLIVLTGYIPQDLNLTWASRLSTALVTAMVLLFAGSVTLAGHPLSLSRKLATVAIFAAAVVLLNLDLYRLFWRKRGLRFTCGAIGTHWGYFLYSGVAFISCCLVELLRAPFRSRTTQSNSTVRGRTRLIERGTTGSESRPTHP